MKDNMRFLTICLFCLFLVHPKCTGQNEQKEFVVLTFTKAAKGIPNSSYHWIVPVDSINNNSHFPMKLTLTPLYLDDSSEFNYKRCMQGDTINYMNGSEEASPSYKQFISDIESILSTRRLLIQKITLKWEYNNIRLTVEDPMCAQEDVYVYATPLTGCFMECLQQHYNGNKLELNQKVYMPIKDISYLPSFWNTKAGDLIKRTNYSYINFSSCVPHGFGEQDISIAVQ